MISIVYMVVDKHVLTIKNKKVIKIAASHFKKMILYTYYSSLRRGKYTFVKTKPNPILRLLSVQKEKIINRVSH
jgi:hypothetical protein